MKKIGLICLVMVMALGVLGVAYAHWQGTLNITGTVTAGTFGANLTQDNGVISNPIDDEDTDPNSPLPSPNFNYINPAWTAYTGWTDSTKTQDIGSATCVLSDEKPAGNVDGVKDTITVNVYKAYPEYDVWVPVDVHCNGTVPIKVYYTLTTGPVAGQLVVEMIADPAVTPNGTTEFDLSPCVNVATAQKLHVSNTARALLHIQGIQPVAGGVAGLSQGASYTITITITYVQAQ